MKIKIIEYNWKIIQHKWKRSNIAKFDMPYDMTEVKFVNIFVKTA